MVVLAMMLSACPRSGSGGDGGADASVPDSGRLGRRDAGAPDAGTVFSAASAATWCADLARAQCLRDANCQLVAADRVDDCVAFALQHNVVVGDEGVHCNQEALNKSLTEGTVGWDAVAALECLNGHFSDCGVHPESCVRAWTGRAQPGQACLVPSVCDADAGFCDPSSTECPPRCKAWKSVDQSCNATSERCRPESLHCAAGMCARNRPVGQLCVEADSCGELAVCMSSACVPTTAKTGQSCYWIAPPFAPRCEATAFCRQFPPDDSGDSPPPGICTRRAGLGDTCAQSYATITGASGDLVVDVESGCQENLRCTGGFSSGGNVTTGVCARRSGPGQPCGWSGDCEALLYCPAATQRCAPFPGPGEKCLTSQSVFASTNVCAAGSVCVSGVCQVARRTGEACEEDGQCLSTSCRPALQSDGGFSKACAPSCTEQYRPTVTE